MKIKVSRILNDGNSTACLIYIDGEPDVYCCGLEDEPRDIKVAGETRIPAGTYRVGVRKVGGFHSKYAKRFPSFHRGMLQILDVPGFTYILIHCGSTEKDTAGCLLVGDDINTTHGKMRLVRSVHAYSRFYKRVIAEAEAGTLTIEYVDDDMQTTYGAIHA